MTTTTHNTPSNRSTSGNQASGDRWCIDSQERSLNFTAPIDFDLKFQDDGMRRGYELLGRVNMEAYIS